MPDACEGILNEKVSFEWSRPADYVHKLVIQKLVYRRTDQACVNNNFSNRYIKRQTLVRNQETWYTATHLCEICLKLAFN